MGIDAREVFALQQIAVADGDVGLHDMFAAGNVCGLLGHVVEGNGPPRPAAGVGVAAVPGQGVVVVDFAGLVHDLARELNVQVFLSTHSKETIDAFVLNGTQVDEVVGYAMSRTGDTIKVGRYDGGQLRRLHEAIDFDLRGVR